MLILLIIVFLFSLVYGLNEVSFIKVLKALLGNVSTGDTVVMIIKQVRLPRTIMACIVGAGLSVSGCVFQAILKNPLADPFTLGISGGAALGVAIAFVFGFQSVTNFFVPFCAFIGMAISVIVVYLVSIRRRFSSKTMILSGVVVSYIFSSAVMLLFALSPSNSVQTAFMWLIGDFSNFDERLLPFITVVILASIIILSLFGNVINAVCFSDEKSKTFGIHIAKNITFLFFTASIITAATVSACGIIGFIGLMIPHAMRKIVGMNNVFLIPVSAFSGAFFLPLCDSLSRILFSPVSIPIGIITNMIGGFFFVCLLLKSDGTYIK
ncbi:MAG: iron ABC transporter permease [Endomicrobium sp.]|jgi:iron complex transport system permease protein|nr:iron ABC transporter permease [Endomicrobium sp.]